jgi:transglutaminase-like putative cysteine protease
MILSPFYRYYGEGRKVAPPVPVPAQSSSGSAGGGWWEKPRINTAVFSRKDAAAKPKRQAPSKPSPAPVIARMRAAVLGDRGAQHPAVREQAISILSSIDSPTTDYARSIAAIHTWMQDHILYVRSPIGKVGTDAPADVLAARSGDCDELSTLEAALLGAVGIESSFVTCALAGRNQQHVYLVAHIPGAESVIPLDPSSFNKPAGWEIDNVTDRHIHERNASPEGVAVLNGIDDAVTARKRRASRIALVVVAAVVGAVIVYKSRAKSRKRKSRR